MYVLMLLCLETFCGCCKKFYDITRSFSFNPTNDADSRTVSIFCIFCREMKDSTRATACLELGDFQPSHQSGSGPSRQILIRHWTCEHVLSCLSKVVRKYAIVKESKPCEMLI